jgi:uncharacterized membrane protein YozB (DUF420 family)
MGTKMGLFNPAAPFLSDINLLFQIAIFIFLAVGLSARLRHRYATHGTVMSIALILDTVSILIVMVPSFLSNPSLFENLSNPLPLTIIHITLGSLAEVFGIFLVTAWALSIHNIEGCVKRKRIMLVTIFLWLVNLILGVYVYALLYLNL